jgi:uncharacterized protein
MKGLKEHYPDLPGTEKLPSLPRESFEALRTQRDSDCTQQPGESPPNGWTKYTNRLFLESSPYLLQHAHNPVNWFSWGKDAFNMAQELDRPILVSIGYSTCHWCHVMEKESFGNEDIALFLNRNFVAIKVDREERPDVDSLFMSALHAMGAQGGWPLNVFLTPDGKPFYGGTYFPSGDYNGGTGFLSLLKRLHEAYHRDRERISRAGNELTKALRKMSTTKPSEQFPEVALMERAVEAFRQGFDEIYGGLMGAPKFPSSLPVRLLLRRYAHSGDLDLLSMVDLTLRQMAAGGIYDQVGGGFHRYATDSRWLIPHFEKMLYDNAQLAIVYLEASQAMGKAEFAMIASEILQYLQDEMRSPEEGFYSATDADSKADKGEIEEGFFFTWPYSELSQILDNRTLKIVTAYYGVTKAGNFDGRNILHRTKTLSVVARQLNLSEDETASLLRGARQLLYQARRRRHHPFTDKKILAGWNGLAISAFARAGLVLNDLGAVDQARNTANFILDKMIHTGRLAHSFQEGEAKVEGFLDDYAFVIAGLLDLFEVTGECLWLERSLGLVTIVERDFEDSGQGGYFLTSPRHEKLLAKEKPTYDGVVPSGNSVMAMNLLRLHTLTEGRSYLVEAQRALTAFSARISAAPAAHSEMLMALDFFLDAPRQLAIIAPRGKREAADPLLDAVRKTYLPNRVLAVVCEGEELDRASELVPFLRGKKAQDERAVAYLCQDRICRLPTPDPALLSRELNNCYQHS